MLKIVKQRFINILNKKLYFKAFSKESVIDIVNSKLKHFTPKKVTENLSNLASISLEQALKQTKSNTQGLLDSQIEVYRNKFGVNEVIPKKASNKFSRFFYCYANPFNILLTVLASISLIAQDLMSAAIIIIMVVVSTTLRFIQEERSKLATDKLKSMVNNTVTVLRQVQPQDDDESISSVKIEISMADLVRGDILLLSAGDLVPADLRVVNSKELFVSQSVLSGEVMPVEKTANSGANSAGKQPSLLSMNNILFMGSNVISGTAKALVIATGNHTYLGSIAYKMSIGTHKPTQFQQGINKVSWLLIRLMFIMAPVVLLINGFTKGDFFEATLFALSIAVGLTPEMLPMIVNATLARGAVFMSKKKVIVKRLDAIQSFGAMDILCTDKTGTLTQDKIILERYNDPFGNVDSQVLTYTYLNSYYQTGLKNLLDRAVLDHVELNQILDINRQYTKVDEIPFDFKRRRMSVVVQENNDHNVLICKGALEEMLSISTKVKENGVEVDLTQDKIRSILQHTQSLNQEGLRVIAVATKRLPLTFDEYSVKDEAELTFLGYTAFLDPPKDSATPAIKSLENLGVRVLVLTGDNQYVAAKVCKDVGLTVEGILLGEDIASKTDHELQSLIATNTIFAKLTPDDKERLINIMRKKGHVVGFMGDGINDAPALKAADIGISVDTAVDIAKEAADLVLLEKSLMVLEAGIEEGRKTFANMLKYIKVTASSNFGNIFSVLIASAFLPFLPMLPIHILIQNLLYDVSQIVIPFDKVDKKSIVKARKWDTKDLVRFMLVFGSISSIFDIITYICLWFAFGANSVDKQSLFQSGWFVEGLISQILIVHVIRARGIPFINSIAAWPLLIMSASVIILAIIIPFLPIAQSLHLQSLPGMYFVYLTFILFAYMASVQLAKKWYDYKYSWQL